MQQARRRLITGANARQKLILKLFLDWHRQWYLLKPWQMWHFMCGCVCLRFVVYVFFLFFSGFRFVAFCGSVSARERSVGRSTAALHRAFGAVSKIYLPFPKYELYVSIYRGFAGMRVSMSAHKESQKMFRSDPRTLQGRRCTGNSVSKLPRDIRPQVASPTY